MEKKLYETPVTRPFEARAGGMICASIPTAIIVTMDDMDFSGFGTETDILSL